MVRFNPYAPEFAADPYAQYRALREQDPVHRSFMGVWFLTRYDDVRRALSSAQLGSDLTRWNGFALRYGRDEPISWLLRHWVLNADPPRHRRIRGALDDAFSGGALASIPSIVSDSATRLLGALRPRAGRETELIDAMARPLPLSIINRIMGIPEELSETIRRCSADLSLLIEPLPDAATLERVREAIRVLVGLFEELLTRDLPADSLLAILRRDGRISRDELLASSIFLLSAGQETTANLIGGAVLALLRHPEHLAAVREQPDRLGDLVEEVLRHDCPLRIAWRTALSEQEIGGRRIRPGEQLMLCLGAANRDPARVPDPDVFDPGRARCPHLSFGAGPHACLGSGLARLEARVILRGLLDRFPEIRLSRPPGGWSDMINHRGLTSLHVDLGPCSRGGEPPATADLRGEVPPCRP